MVSAFQERWFWCRGSAWRWKRKYFRRFWIGGITCWRLVPNARTDRIIRTDSISHFEMPESHGNDSKARKLHSVRVKRRFFCLWTAASDRIGKGFYITFWPATKKEVHCDNPKHIKLWKMPGHASTPTAKPNIHCAKVMLCIWWNQLCVVYYELLKPIETITGDRYQT